MISFEAPSIGLLLPIPWLVRRALKALSDNNQNALRVPSLERFSNLHAEQHRHRQQTITFIALIVFWLALLAAAARPTWYGEPIALERSGRDLLLAVDVSESMQRADFVVSARRVDRLTAVKVVLAEFIQKRKQDRLGLILFGTQAYLQAPLTLDHVTLKRLLDEAAIGIAGPKTAIGDAIGLSIKRLEKESAKHRIVILLTDGSNTAGELSPLQAAQLAKEAGVRIYTISLGASYMLDQEDRTLIEVAQLTGGKAFNAQDTQSLAQIYAQLDEIETATLTEETVRPQRALGHWPLSLAMIALVLALAPRWWGENMLNLPLDVLKQPFALFARWKHALARHDVGSPGKSEVKHD